MEDFGYQKDDEQSNFSGSLKRNFLIGATLFSIACFIYITVSAYYFVYQDQDSNIETIKSPEEPIKVTEDDSVNEDEKSIKNSIYDDIFGNKKESIINGNTKIRTLYEPAIPPKINSESEFDRRLIKESSSAPEEMPLLSNNKITKDQKSKDQRIIVFSDKPKEEKGAKDLLTQNKAEEKPASAVAVKEKIPDSANANVNKKRIIRVQIAALASENAAKDYWKKLRNNNSELLSNLKPFVEEVNLGKRGIFHRLQIGNFFNQNEAEEFCNHYIAKTHKSRADCIIVE